MLNIAKIYFKNYIKTHFITKICYFEHLVWFNRKK